ncbi:MAG: hypothetical protein KJ645_09715 [Planctomycetes bacterium]|nr:hypothetical protein [Planctomycetota bacterium]
MSLFVFLVITLILCALLLLVQGSEAKSIKLMAVISIGLEVVLLLQQKGAFDLSLPIPLEVAVPCVTGALGLFGLFKMSERALPLLIFFASLLQFFMETTIIDSIR